MNTTIVLNDAGLYEGVGPLSTDKVIINVGFAGSNKLPIGSIWSVDSCSAYQVNDLPQGCFVLKTAKFLPTQHCYSSTDFVSSTPIKECFLVDMELLAYAACPYPVYSIKVVSDNMEIDKYFDEALNKDFTVPINEVLESLGVD